MSVGSIRLSLAQGWFLGMLPAIEGGRRLGMESQADDQKTDKTSFGLIVGGIFGLPGLLSAFFFSEAASRLDVLQKLPGMAAAEPS